MDANPLQIPAGCWNGAESKNLSNGEQFEQNNFYLSMCCNESSSIIDGWRCYWILYTETLSPMFSKTRQTIFDQRREC